MTRTTAEKTPLILAIGVLVVFGVATTQPVQDDKGRSTFIDKGCADCHSIYGNQLGGRDGRGGPDLGKKNLHGSYMEVAADMWNHFPGMLKKYRKEGREFPDFTEEETGRVIQYLSFIRYIDEPGHVRTGRKILRSKRCTTCHRSGGPGPEFRTLETYLSPLSFATAMWNHGPDMLEAIAREEIDPPSFRRHEIVDVAAAVRAAMAPTKTPADPQGNAEVGRELVLSLGCTTCHTVKGEGGESAPELGDLDPNLSVTEMAGTMWNHLPDMWNAMNEMELQFPTLETQEMADILAFLYSLSREDKPGDPDRGLLLLDDRGCNSCHSSAAENTGDAPDFSEVGALDSRLSLVYRMWNHATTMNRAVRDRRMDWPRLTGPDLSDIYAYLGRSEDSPGSR